MKISRILIANRGEVSIRIARAAADLGIDSVAIYSADDAKSLHVLAAGESCALQGRGASAYLDIEQIISLAKSSGCDAIHPGYGFLSESALFARRCAEEDIIFIGPRPDILDLFGNKAEARSLAARCKVPLLPGTTGATSLKEARTFFKSLGPGAAVMIKAVMGGGGRGIRAVTHPDELGEAFARCQSEAAAAFGVADVYVEQLLKNARHIEVQVVGDGHNVIHLGERDCTLQRRNQKLIEVAPCPTLSAKLRDSITSAAIRLARETRYLSLGTFEFLVGDSGGKEAVFAFMEANPRLQVEHTVTEEVTGIDLVKQQLLIALGEPLKFSEKDIHFRGHAIECRINAEDPFDDFRPCPGRIEMYYPPGGRGVRIDTHAYAGYTIPPHYDSLIGKLITYGKDRREAMDKMNRALSEYMITGIKTTIPFEQAILQDPNFRRGVYATNFIDNLLGGARRELIEEKA